MAEVVWPETVIVQLDEITAYVSAVNPPAGDLLIERLVALGESLAVFPNRGRPAPGGAREMTNIPPYVLRYRVIGAVVVITDIRHGRRRPLS